MPYIKPVSQYSNVNFLASQTFQSFTELVPITAGAVVNGKRVAVAGTIYPANDATAKGILLHDVHLDDGPQPAALIVEGYILKDRLPVAPDAAAITALTNIKFR